MELLAMNRMNESTDTPRGGRPQLRVSAPPAQSRRSVTDMPSLRRTPESAASRGSPEGRRLVVAKDITLTGQISKCDFLVVEGAVEGMRYEGQSLEVAEGGSFNGNIEVDNAEVSGSFDGSISVRGRLTIRPTGRVAGTIRYGEIEINAGGQVTGEMSVMELSATLAGQAAAASIANANGSGSSSSESSSAEKSEGLYGVEIK
jgi:cytoskeletal protein CcmA (bactofilin family)